MVSRVIQVYKKPMQYKDTSLKRKIKAKQKEKKNGENWNWRWNYGMIYHSKQQNS